MSRGTDVMGGITGDVMGGIVGDVMGGIGDDATGGATATETYVSPLP
jgi:hypothetical protein